MNMQRMLTPKEISSILNISVRTVRRLAESRVIPGSRKIGNVWRFDPLKFSHWLSDLEKPESNIPFQPVKESIPKKTAL